MRHRSTVRVLLDQNPLEKVDNTRSVVGVVLRGSWLDQAALDALLVDALSASTETEGP